MVLFILTAVLAASAGLLWWGIGWAVMSVAVFTALTRNEVDVHDDDRNEQAAGSRPVR